jgi:AraC family transcriptional regulator, regulatory protein of adaptative response / methylated-DNA-[protein]-cysteine methyltransferase
MSVMATTHETASPPFAHNAERWAAVVRRDGHTDGLLYYAVQTTGVYCRPSCPARLAQREHVQFHATCDAAEQASFRPCKRCCPNAAALAKAAGMSRYHFHRVFTAITGVTPKAYAAAHRAQRVRDALSRTATVTEAIYRAGFHSHGRFYATSSEVLGMTPTHLRSGGHGTTIWFAIGECSLGAILVAKSDRGVCAIPLGDDPDELARDLQDRFPRANLIGDDGAFEQLVAQVVDFVEAPGIGLDLPLDVRGTAFQQRVWQALREIPAGETASYTDIANRIGSPNSVRAVAQACAANAPAVAIPCHRVVRNDGGLSGYRWGMERKRAQLEKEAHA